MECSSKEMVGIEEVFETAINTAVGQRTPSAGQGVSLNPGRRGKKTKKRSCKIL